MIEPSEVIKGSRLRPQSVVARLNRCLRAIYFWVMIGFFLAVVVSWVASLKWPHAIVVTGRREYALVADGGQIVWRVRWKTDCDWNAPRKFLNGFPIFIVCEVPLRPAGEPPTVQFSQFPLHMTFPWRPTLIEYRTRAGGEIPFLRSDNTIEYLPFGETTTTRALPHWLIAAALAVPIGGCAWIVFRRRRAAKRVGHCATCGYDLRASPDRCPECGTATIRKNEPTTLSMT